MCSTTQSSILRYGTTGHSPLLLLCWMARTVAAPPLARRAMDTEKALGALTGSNLKLKLEAFPCLEQVATAGGVTEEELPELVGALVGCLKDNNFRVCSSALSVLRITIDRDRVIQHAEAITITGPYAICPTANAVFDNLVGLQIGPGWRRKVQTAIGGRHGCTHITELLGPVATIAYQTLYGEEARQKRQSGTLSDQDKQASQSQLANSCVGYADDSSAS